MAAILKNTGGYFVLRNKKFEFLDPTSCLKFSIKLISRLKETKYSEYDFYDNCYFKNGGHFEK